MTVTTVDEYLASLPGPTRAAVDELRARIRAVAPDTGEAVGYSILAVTAAGRVVFYVGGWRRHLGLYPVPRFEGTLEDAVAPYRAATDTVRLPLALPLPDVVEPLVRGLLDHAGVP